MTEYKVNESCVGQPPLPSSSFLTGSGPPALDFQGPNVRTRVCTYSFRPGLPSLGKKE